MQSFATTCEQIAATTKKLEKTAMVAAYLRSLPLEEAATAAIFLSGRPFAAWDERTLQVGGALLWRAVSEVTGAAEGKLKTAYRKHGDLGAAAAEVWSARQVSSLRIADVRAAFDAIAAARGPATKSALLRDLLTKAAPLEAKYLIKIITGDLRIGLKESLVEEAIAKAFDATLAQVQRANMLLGDIGETLKLAATNRLAEAHMRIFHPLGFMLASPAEAAADALAAIPNAWVEDKYDGIRAQAHCREGEVRIFSRTRDDITESFPEVATALSGLPGEAILDGEILAWRDGKALAFSELQQRLGRKKASEDLMRTVPVAYQLFDVLYANDEVALERPLSQRSALLERLLQAPQQPLRVFAQGGQHDLFANEPVIAEILRAPFAAITTLDQLEARFEEALERGNEGLMIKDAASRYTPGRRGRAWLKLKRELATLDVVVTAAEYGHGKRAGVLSDYTFAVRDGEDLKNVGKAYSGLTDAEIAEWTKWFLKHTAKDEGFRRQVEPKLVIEVAFNAVMESDRHASGYALRFPRIVRLRPDKPVDEIDTLEQVRAIFEGQKWRR